MSMTLKPLQVAQLLGALRKVDKAKFESFHEVRETGRICKYLDSLISELGEAELRLKKQKAEIQGKFQKATGLADKIENVEEQKKARIAAFEEYQKELEEYDIERLQSDFETAANEDIDVVLSPDHAQIVKNYIEKNYKSTDLNPELINELAEKLDSIK